MGYKEVTINFNKLELVVKGRYQKGDNGVWRFSDGSGQPPTPPEFEISAIYNNGRNLIDIYESFDVLEKIEELVINKIEL